MNAVFTVWAFRKLRNKPWWSFLLYLGMNSVFTPTCTDLTENCNDQLQNHQTDQISTLINSSHADHSSHADQQFTRWSDQISSSHAVHTLTDADADWSIKVNGVNRIRCLVLFWRNKCQKLHHGTSSIVCIDSNKISQQLSKTSFMKVKNYRMLRK